MSKIKNSIVGFNIVKNLTSKSEIRKSVFSLLNEFKIKDKIEIPPHARIMIKPNICFVKGYETGATVDPFVVRCLVEWLQQNYDIETIFIGEADATQLNVDIAFKVLGWEDEMESLSDVKLLNLSKDEQIEIELNGLYFKKLKMSKNYMESDYLISVGKLKTHSICGFTCILKNQFGVNPIKNKVQYHKHLSEVIHDLNKVKIPDLCLVDGIIAMEGNGPVAGIPKPLGLLVAGNDPVSVDYACARIMGLKIKEVPPLKLAIKYGLGDTDYEMFGDLNSLNVNFKTGQPLLNKIAVKAYKSRTINKLGELLKKFVLSNRYI